MGDNSVLTRTLVSTLVLALLCSACQKREPAAAAPAAKPAQVDATRIVQADQDPGNWLSHGRTYSEQRFTPLDADQRRQRQQLGLAWFADLDTQRGQEATPLVIDGVMYVTSAWSKVLAHRRGDRQALWEYDPKCRAKPACKRVLRRRQSRRRGVERQGLSSARSTAG